MTSPSTGSMWACKRHRCHSITLPDTENEGPSGCVISIGRRSSRSLPTLATS